MMFYVQKTTWCCTEPRQQARSGRCTKHPTTKACHSAGIHNSIISDYRSNALCSLWKICFCDSEIDEYDAVDPKGDLLIGNSLIWDILPTNPTLTVDVNRGATLGNIHRKLWEIDPRKTQYERVFIVAGTNDTSTKRPADKIAQEINHWSRAKCVAKSVTISSIPPHTDNNAVKVKIDNANQLFLTVANQAKAAFINHDNNFVCRDDTAEDCCFLSNSTYRIVALQNSFPTSDWKTR